MATRTVTYKFNKLNRKGEVISIETRTREFPHRLAADNFVAQLQWVNENRTGVGKYFDISRDGAAVRDVRKWGSV